MSDIVTIFDKDVVPKVFDSAGSIFPEFEFKRRGDNWISTNGRKLSGDLGVTIGKVGINKSHPHIIRDWRSEHVEITKYVRAQGKASNWIEAVKYLAGQVNVDIPDEKLSDSDRARIEDSELKTQLLESANGLFIRNLCEGASEGAQKARNYLIARGYEDVLPCLDDSFEDRAGRMKLGYITSLQDLGDHWRKEGFSQKDTERLFFNQVIDGQPKRQRSEIGESHVLSIPLYNTTGKVAGFSFRAIEDTGSLPKYLNQTGLKKGSLFNLRAVNRGRPLIVVEGLLDALHAEARGIQNIISLGGKEISGAQLETIQSSGVEEVTLCLDNDQAGREATLKAIGLIRAKAESLKIYVASLPEGIKDPDQLIRENGSGALKDAIQDAESEYLYRLRLALKGLDKGPVSDKERDRIISAVRTIHGDAKSTIERELIENALKKYEPSLGISVNAFREEDLKAKQEREERRRTALLRSSISQADSMIEAGRPDEAVELLSNIGKHELSRIHENRFDSLLKTPSEHEFYQLFRDVSDELPSGLKFKGEELLIPTGAITIVAGPTSHGKTSFLINLALNVATRDLGEPRIKPVHFFTFEESLAAISLKVLNTRIAKDVSANNKRSIRDFLKTGATQYFKGEAAALVPWEISKAYSEIIQTGRLRIHDGKDLSSEDLVDVIKFLHGKDEVGAVFVDYMQLLKARKTQSSSRQEDLKQICLDLKNCAVETGLPLILGAQFNRQVTSRETVLATNIGEAGDIERIANLIVGIWNNNFPEANMGEPDKNNLNTITAKILKGRDIEPGAQEIFDFNGNTGKIKN